MTSRTCADCPAPISRLSKGRCRACATRALNADPEMMARRRAGLSRYYDEEGGRLLSAERMAEHNRNLSDEQRERRRAHGRRQYREHLNTPECRARSSGPDARRRARDKREETILGWCPPHLRDEYRALVRNGHVNAAEARRMIEARIPGTNEHAVRVVANTTFAMQLKNEREKAQAY